MAQFSARRIALAALRRWRGEKRFADSIISEFLAQARLTDSDRAFALEQFYGVLRNLTLLDFWIGCLRLSRVDADLRDVLQLGSSSRQLRTQRFTKQWLSRPGGSER